MRKIIAARLALFGAAAERLHDGLARAVPPSRRPTDWPAGANPVRFGFPQHDVRQSISSWEEQPWILERNILTFNPGWDSSAQALMTTRRGRKLPAASGSGGVAMNGRAVVWADGARKRYGDLAAVDGISISPIRGSENPRPRG